MSAVNKMIGASASSAVVSLATFLGNDNHISSSEWLWTLIIAIGTAIGTYSTPPNNQPPPKP